MKTEEREVDASALTQIIKDQDTALRNIAYLLKENKDEVKRLSGVVKNLEHRLNAQQPKKRRLRTLRWEK